MRITNTQNGPRGVNTTRGPVLIEPGQSVEADLSPAELEIARGTGWFSFEGNAKPAGGDDAKREAGNQARRESKAGE